MRAEATPLPGLLVLEIEPVADERGFFARTWSRDEVRAVCPAFDPVQSSVSWSAKAHTLRGLHWQAEPHAETKLVRVTQGAVFDVAVDLRPGSATRGRWFGTQLSAANRRSLLIPRGFAHGLITLADATEVLYVMDAAYAPAAARGARWDDPAFGIEWPAEPAVIGERDRNWPAWSATA
ncbi:MAG: dTDP-4-dehydrorhamnose 3,5-epimerase [Alsobacter sp.]